MANYGVAEAKNRFTQLLDQVERGETITITRHGKPVAELRATPNSAKMTMEERLAKYDAFVARREAQPSYGISAEQLVREMRDDGY